ncbi:hypothetical protein LXM94_00720 [Rhizobium sp. TRM95111]|uniref:hypothetical protein n=1 Tax=Rhizobium alarense TaxID=2846851 RepID=UPI001F40080D|nr:hypothetical protein [Rhizobium alarense]MCF3638490.1 hypothetical protein [Rhizobium alarense]
MTAEAGSAAFRMDLRRANRLQVVCRQGSCAESVLFGPEIVHFFGTLPREQGSDPGISEYFQKNVIKTTRRCGVLRQMVLYCEKYRKSVGNIMSRTPEEWGRLLGSTLAKMNACESRKAPLSTDSYRVIAETIACVMAEARAEGYEHAMMALEEKAGVPRILHA